MVGCAAPIETVIAEVRKVRKNQLNESPRGQAFEQPLRPTPRRSARSARRLDLDFSPGVFAGAGRTGGRSPRLSPGREPAGLSLPRFAGV